MNEQCSVILSPFDGKAVSTSNPDLFMQMVTGPEQKTTTPNLQGSRSLLDPNLSSDRLSRQSYLMKLVSRPGAEADKYELEREGEEELPLVEAKSSIKAGGSIKK